MLLRKALLIALVVAPFVYGPSEASAQSGLDHAAVATAKADEVGAGQNSQAPQDMPAGVAKQFAGLTLPPGIQRTRGEAEAPPADDETGGDDTSGGDLECYKWELQGFNYECTEWGPVL